MKAQRSEAAERLLREAMRLFAERGYVRTSVPDIQEAAGLSRGSGALYKHYASKEALLRAGVERFILESQQARTNLGDLNLPPREALEWIARRMLGILAAKHDELRILWRDIEQFPKLKARARHEIMQSSYLAVAECLRAHTNKGELPDHDHEAVAAVIIGSLAMFRVFEALWGERSIKIDDERFLRAWSGLVTRGLGLEEPPRAKDAAVAKHAGRSGSRRSGD